MRIKQGDRVKIITGPENIKGVVGNVIRVMREKQRVVVEGLPALKRHMKPERSKKFPEGGIIEKARSVHVSNVMLMPEGSERPARSCYEFRDGKKVRVLRGRAVSATVV